MMITNLFVIANVKQLRTGGCFRILLPFFRTSWSVGVLNSAIFNSFHSRVEDGTILEGLRNFGGFEPHPKHPPGTPLDDRVLSLKNGAVEIHGRFGGTELCLFTYKYTNVHRYQIPSTVGFRNVRVTEKHKNLIQNCDFK